MLPNSEHVKQVLFDKNGAAETLKNSAIVIDMSTIHPLETDDIRSKLNDNNVSMIDCPIGRTSVEARLGKSLLMLGGEKNDIIKATPILNLIGDTLKDCGGPGMGSRMKIVNNYMTTVLNLSLIHISEPTRLGMISYAVFCLKKKTCYREAVSYTHLTLPTTPYV